MIIRSRAISKPGIKNDEIVVKELVWPFYMKTLSKSNINYTLNTFDMNGNRIDKDIIINMIIGVIHTL